MDLCPCVVKKTKNVSYLWNLEREFS